MVFSIRNTQGAADNFSLLAHNCKHIDVGNCGCRHLERTDHIKYLGVTLNKNLKFGKHFELLNGRIRKLMYVFKNLRQVATPKLIKQLYKALCQSLISYCITS
jgi:hypothetical protein